MSTRSDIHIEDGEAHASVARGKATSPSSAQPRRGDAQILQFQARSAAASLALEDASDPVEGFESIGSLAVRIVGQFKLPRINVVLARE